MLNSFSDELTFLETRKMEIFLRLLYSHPHSLISSAKTWKKFLSFYYPFQELKQSHFQTLKKSRTFMTQNVSLSFKSQLLTAQTCHGFGNTLGQLWAVACRWQGERCYLCEVTIWDQRPLSKWQWPQDNRFRGFFRYIWGRLPGANSEKVGFESVPEARTGGYGSGEGQGGPSRPDRALQARLWWPAECKQESGRILCCFLGLL